MSDITVNLPNGRGVARFPAGTPPEVIQSEVEKVLVPSTSDALAGAIGQGATLGFGDEAAAFARATFPTASNFMMSGPALKRDESIGGSPTPQTVSTAPDWQARYEEELGKARQQQKDFHAANPVLATAGNIGGGLATAALALPGAVTAAGPSLLGNMARLGLTGGALGGVQGFGEGEGGLGNRLTSAAVGGAGGAILGGLAPVVGAGARRLMETAPGRAVSEKVIAPGLRMLADVLGQGAPAKSLSAAAPDGTPGITGESFLTRAADSYGNAAERGAIDRLATALQRSGGDANRIQSRLDRLGPEAMLADTDPQFLSEARRANTLPGQTKTTAKIALESRDRQAGDRLVKAFEGDEPPPSSFRLRGKDQAFDENLRAVGSDAYGLMKDAGLKTSPELEQIYKNQYVADAISAVGRIERGTRTAGKNGEIRTEASPVEIMHKVKQTIWDMGFDKDTARPGPNASFFRNLGIEYMNRLKAANPELAAADARYAQAASLPEHFDAGRSFLLRGGSEKATDVSAPGLADMLSRADQQQALAARAGATNAVRETALEGTKPARALAQRVDQSQLVQAKLAELYGPQRAAQIIKQAEAEGTFAETSNEIMRGSKTADKFAEALDTGNAGFRVSPSGVKATMFERLKDLPEMLMKPNEPIRDAIGRLTLRGDAAENRRILKLAEELLKRRAQGSPASAALAATTANSLTGP